VNVPARQFNTLHKTITVYHVHYNVTLISKISHPTLAVIVTLFAIISLLSVVDIVR